MSEKPLDTKRLIEIEAEVVTLWNGVEDQIDSVHNFAQAAVRGAWEIGRRLIEAKVIVGHGNFQVWKQKLGIPDGTAFNYMKLAANFQTLESLPENKRQAYLAIGLLPDKDQIHHDGNTRLVPSNNLLSVFNRWNNWHTQVENGKKAFVVNDEIKKQLKPMYDWIKGIYGEA